MSQPASGAASLEFVQQFVASSSSSDTSSPAATAGLVTVVTVPTASTGTEVPGVALTAGFEAPEEQATGGDGVADGGVGGEGGEVRGGGASGDSVLVGRDGGGGGERGRGEETAAQILKSSRYSIFI